MQQEWSFLPGSEPPEALIELVGGHRVVAQLLSQRGLSDPHQARAFLDPNHYTPTPPSALLGIDTAAELLAEVLRRKANILVWGDFDVDGQTSTSLLVSALQDVTEPECVRFHVPNRFTESHGMRLPKLTELVEGGDFRPDLILTCDTGVTDGDSIGYAKDSGIQVIITDHHDPPPELASVAPDVLWGQAPETVGAQSVRRADAIVNPKFMPADDPLRSLPGVGVAYKLVQRLYAVLGIGGQEEELLDLVALGIVADVAEQVHDARYLLQRGLEKLRTTRRTGLLALMDVSRLNPATVDSDSIGFQLGPRLNALGRLEDATVSVELLTTRDAIRAGQLAARLERLNQQRRLLTSQITAAALEMIERDPRLLDFQALVLAHPAWHAGIVGIVASRLAEQFQKPTVLLLTPPGEPARGSARSVPGVDIGASIAACSHLLLTHGGHPGAAGVSLLPENIDHFRRELDRQVEQHRIEEVPPGVVIDARVDLGGVTMGLAEQLQRLAPFGNGNPKPKFMSSGLGVTRDQRVGREGSHRQLQVQDANGAQAQVIWFGGADAELPAGGIDLAYTIDINRYRDESSVQLTFVAARPAAQAVEVRGRRRKIERSIVDLRVQEGAIDDLPHPPAAAWYVEGIAPTGSANGTGVEYAPRSALILAEKNCPLVLWSAPPSMHLLRWIVQTVEPPTIYLVGKHSGDDTTQAILRQLAGMCKFALQRDRKLNLNRMAERLGITEAAVRHGLAWLEANGHIRLVEWMPDDLVEIAAGSGAQADDPALAQALLDEELGEIRSFRRFFLRARPDELGLTG